LKHALAVALLVAWTPARAATHTYAIVIGNNTPPATADGPLAPLRYADDDAVAVAQFLHTVADDVVLLSVLDGDTQRRFPGVASGARPPTLVELRAQVARLRARIDADRARGGDADVVLFFSGHGAHDEHGASLVLLDGPLTRAVLYDEVLAVLPARFIHVFVDACHAAAVVQPRDTSAAVVDVTESDARRLVASETLARFPNVGALVATSAGEETHEWDRYQGGVFTHELLSGLRGAADVNGDRRIEYSELQAFLAAANREVSDPRGRLRVEVRPPPLDLRVPIVELARARKSGWAAVPGGVPFHIEDGRGARLVDGYGEPGHTMTLVLPVDDELYYRAPDGEARFRVIAGRVARLDRASMRGASIVARDALATAFERGLFAAPFGPAYYRGFVDRAGSTPVVFASGDDDAASARRRTRRRASLASFTLSGAALTAATVTGALALQALSDWHATDLQRPAADARTRYQALDAAAFATLGVGLTALAVGAVVFPWHASARAH
jgi:caspase domain-containing protein